MSLSLHAFAQFLRHKRPPARHTKHIFKRAQRGLFGNKMRMTGHHVSFSNKKSNRVWKPNVQLKTFYSDLLERRLRLRVTTHVIRCVDKAGGLDNYLLYTKERHVNSDLGSRLRGEMRERFREVTGEKFVRLRREENDRLLREALAVAKATQTAEEEATA